MFPANCHRAFWNPRARRRQTWSVQPLVKDPKIRKPRRKTEHVNVVNSPRMNGTNCLFAQPGMLRHPVQIRTAVVNRYLNNGPLAQGSRFDTAQSFMEIGADPEEFVSRNASQADQNGRKG